MYSAQYLRMFSRAELRTAAERKSLANQEWARAAALLMRSWGSRWVMSRTSSLASALTPFHKSSGYWITQRELFSRISSMVSAAKGEIPVSLRNNSPVVQHVKNDPAAEDVGL